MSRASYARVQATVGAGTVLIWDFGVAYTRGGGSHVKPRHPTPAQSPYSLWALDIYDFFPSMDQQDTLNAIRRVHVLIVEGVNGRMQTVGFGLQYTGVTGVWTTWAKEQGSKLRAILLCKCTNTKWELMENCLFTVSNQISKQVKGVAIGGALSAQLSCLYCIDKPHSCYSQNHSEFRTQVSKPIPPSLLPHRPFRFCDNMVGVSQGHLNLQRVLAPAWNSPHVSLLSPGLPRLPYQVH